MPQTAACAPEMAPVVGYMISNWRLFAVVVMLQLVMIVLPAIWSIHYSLLATLTLIIAGVAAFSTERMLLVSLALTIVLPAKMLQQLILPPGLHFQEILLLITFGFAALELSYRRHLWLRRGFLDGAVLLFLLVILVASVVGLLRGHSLSLIVREVRYPLYYFVYFLIVSFVGQRSVHRYFLPVLLLASLTVSGEYILEFLGAIDLSTGNRFVRVARLQGLVLPLSLLFLTNLFLYNPRRYGRGLILALAVPVLLAFVLTVGRGMWVATGAGLLCTAFVYYFDLPASRRRFSSILLLLVTVGGLAVGTTLVFQHFTGASVGAHAAERSRTFVEVQRDVLVLVRLSAYAAAIEVIADHPFLGSGMGATITYPTINVETNEPDRWTTHQVDSLYLALLLKMGVMGLAAFAWLYFRSLRQAYNLFKRSSRRADRAFAGGVVAVLTAMAVLGLTDGSMVNGRFALVFAILFGLVATLARVSQEEVV